MTFEILQYSFFQRALLAAVLVSIAAGIIGTYIVVKKMSLVTGSIAHAAFGGLGISYFFKFPLFLGALIFSLFSAFIINTFRIKNRERLDSLLNMLWSVGMSIGLIFMFLTPGYSTDLFSYLFGNILLVGWSDIIFMLILDIVIVILVSVFYNTLLTTVYNEDYARIRNLLTKILYGVLFLLISLTVVLVIRVVGIVLMIALLTIPAATARLLTNSLKSMMVISVLITLLTTVLGIFISYAINLPAGPVIVLLGAGVYLLAIAFKRFL